MNPILIAEQLGQLGVDLDKAVKHMGELEDIAVDSEGDFKAKYSKVFRESAGSIKDREQIAFTECETEWRIWGKAAAAVRLQKEHIRALHARIDVGRTLASNVRAEVGLARTGIHP